MGGILLDYHFITIGGCLMVARFSCVEPTDLFPYCPTLDYSSDYILDIGYS